MGSLLAGCVGDSAIERTTLAFAQWPGAFRDAAEVGYVDPFEAEHDVTVDVFDHPVDPSTIPDHIISRAHDFELVSHWNYTVPRGVEGGAFHPIRQANVPHLERVEDEFHPASVGFDPGEAFHHVPYSIGGNIIVYNADEIDEPSSWDRLLDDDLAGRVWMPRDPSMLLGILAKQAGLSLEAIEGNEPVIWELVRQYDEVVANWWTNPAAVDEAFTDGTIDAAGYWSGRAYALQQDGHPIEFTVPEEGSNAWIEVLSIPDDVSEEKRELAEQLINFALREESILAFADEIGYAVPYDIDEAVIPADHIYQDHPTRDRIGEGDIEVWDAAILARNEAEWEARLQELTR